MDVRRSASELARLDELISMYTMILEVCSQRDALLSSGIDDLVQTASHRLEASPLGLGECTLRAALHEQPQHFSSAVEQLSSVFGVLTKEHEDAFQALMQVRCRSQLHYERYAPVEGMKTQLTSIAPIALT